MLTCVQRGQIDTRKNDYLIAASEYKQIALSWIQIKQTQTLHLTLSISICACMRACVCTGTVVYTCTCIRICYPPSSFRTEHFTWSNGTSSEAGSTTACTYKQRLQQADIFRSLWLNFQPLIHSYLSNAMYRMCDQIKWLLIAFDRPFLPVYNPLYI